MDATELRTKLASVLSDDFLRYMQSDQIAIDHAGRDKDLQLETACLELPAKPVLFVTGRVNER